MLQTVVFEIVIIVVLMLANGFFAASEIAVVSARKSRLEQQAQDGRRGAGVALELAENPNRFLSTVQVGITLIGTFAAAFGGASLARALEGALVGVPTLAPYASTIALGAVVIGISYLSLIVGELVPKRLALQNAEGVAATVAPVMRVIARVGSPVVWLLTASTELVLRLLHRQTAAEQPVTEDDIMALVREGAEGGTVDASEQELITSVFTFTDRTVRSLMTPRTQMVAIDVQTPMAEVVQRVIDSGYSRIPVYDETLDRMVGVLYAKDVLRAEHQAATSDLRSLLRAPTYVLATQRAMKAFQQLKQARSALALVLDEYGQVAGLVTLEDMLEALVGEIDDEYDDVAERVVRREDGSYLVDGLVSVDDLLERLALPEADELARAHGVETVAGLVLVLLGHMPRPGSRITWHSYTFEVVDMDGRRIDKLIITPPPATAHEQTKGLLASGAVRPPPDLPSDRP
jgi:putative hemolysin